MKEKFNQLGMFPQLVLAIILGLLVGQLSWLPVWLLSIPVTFSAIFSTFLGFIVPLMIVAFVVNGIANIEANAGKVLGATIGLNLTSLISVGMLTYFIVSRVFPMFINPSTTAMIDTEARAIAPLVELHVESLFNVPTGVILALIMGLALGSLRQRGQGQTLHQLFMDLRDVIVLVLERVIIPLIPIYVFGNFVNLSYSGQAFKLLKTLGFVYLTLIIIHYVVLLIEFALAAWISKKSFITLLKNQLPAYAFAFGTQSSTASIPANLIAAEKNGISRPVREFAIPFCATGHMPGSLTTLTSLVTAVLMIQQMPHDASVMIPFVLALSLSIIVAPGVPGGAVMTALPILGMVGIPTGSTLATMMITLYIAQDSFGTSINVSADNAIAAIIDRYYHRNHS